MNVPLCSFTTVSLMITVQVPIPDSPLVNVSGVRKRDGEVRTNERRT